LIQTINLREYPTTVRVPGDLRERLEPLIPKVGPKSTVLKLAVAEGTRASEQRYSNLLMPTGHDGAIPHR